MPIDSRIIAPVRDSSGAKAIPKIDFQCNPGAVADMTWLRCCK